MKHYEELLRIIAKQRNINDLQDFLSRNNHPGNDLQCCEMGQGNSPDREAVRRGAAMQSSLSICKSCSYGAHTTLRLFSARGAYNPLAGPASPASP